jgi:hypothetical protein
MLDLDNPIFKDPQKFKEFIFELAQSEFSIDDFTKEQIDTYHKDFFEYMEIKVFSPTDTGLSYRVLNHWSKKGLVDDVKERKNKWRKFSLKDLIWINILIELRRFGVPIKTLLNVKSWFNGSIFTSISSPPYKRKDVYIFMAFTATPVNAVLNFMGTGYLIHGTTVHSFWMMYSPYPNIHINLNSIIGKIFNKPSLSFDLEIKEPMTLGEKEILRLIKEQNYTEIRIKFENGKAKLFEGTEHINTQGKKIIDLLNEYGYQEIRLLKHNGDLVEVKRTIKKKLN